MKKPFVFRSSAFAVSLAALLICFPAFWACSPTEDIAATSDAGPGLDDATAPEGGAGEADASTGLGDGSADEGASDAGTGPVAPEDAGEMDDAGEPPVSVPECGDGVLSDGEACDDGNLETGDGCDAACAIERHQARFMSWNVQAEHLDWGGSAVEPRVAAMCDILATMQSPPDIISLQEFSPAWHAEENFACLSDLGYALAVADAGLYTEVAYRADAFELVEAGTSPIASNFSGDVTRKKTCVTWAVLRARQSGKLFAAFSTHWDPNNGVSLDQSLEEMVATVAALEAIRVEGARQSAELIADVTSRHSGALVLYGGDFNTLDATTFATLAQILGYLVSYDVASIESAHGTLGQASGLWDARQSAKSFELPIIDASTTSISDFPETLANVLKSSGLAIVIDFVFYDSTLALKSYEVMNDAVFSDVSDHFPVNVLLEYDAL